MVILRELVLSVTVGVAAWYMCYSVTDASDPRRVTFSVGIGVMFGLVALWAQLHNRRRG